MSQDLLRRIMFPPMADEVLLHVKVVEQRGRDLVVYLAADVDGDPELPKNIHVTCHSFKETNLAPGHYERLSSYHEHVLLWEYNQPRVLASFHGHVDEPLSVVGALYEQHVALVGGWIPFSKYFNADLPLSELVRGGFGMLAEGPEPLILAYEEVMSKHGVSISHHQSAAPQNEVLSVLIFDKSYVIAERFSAEAA